MQSDFGHFCSQILDVFDKGGQSGSHKTENTDTHRNIALLYSSYRSIRVTPLTLRRNIGSFKLDCDFVKYKPEEVAQIFSLLKIVPVRAEVLFAENEIEYTAIGERFRE